VNRHHRQEILPEIGGAGQARLRESHALIVGVGALGSTIAEALVRAGVGKLTIVDRDVVELTNLQRQTLYTTEDAERRRAKATAARDRLAEIDPGVEVRALVEDFSARTAPGIVGFAWEGEAEDAGALTPGPSLRGRGEAEGERGTIDLLLDGTDNFETRYLLNDVAVSQGLAYVHAGVVGTSGTLLTVRPGVGPCLRCLFPDAPAPGAEPTCDTAGVLGPAAWAVASLAAAEAIKLLAGHVDDANTRLIHLDAYAPAMRAVDVSGARDPECPCCGKRDFQYLDGDAEELTPLCGRKSVQIAPHRRGRVALETLAARLAPFGDFRTEADSLRGEFANETGEFGRITLHVFSTGRAIVGGTTDPARAKTIYSRYVGG